MKHKPILVLVLMSLTLLAWSPAQAQYLQTDKVLTSGHRETLKSNGANKLYITYRPGSNISRQDSIETSGATFNWTPDKAGIFALSTPGGPSQTVSVQFGSFPLAGLIVLIIAATILFGGAIYASVNLFGDSPKKTAT